MSALSLKTEELLQRPQVVSRLLRALRDQNVPCDLARAKQGNCKVLSAHGGEGDAGRDYRERRFRTYSRSLWCQYYEFWREADGGRRFELERAYLHTFRMDSATRGFSEVVCIHCDPDEECQYRRGPHLHVKSLLEGVPSCHFLLCLGVQRSVLSSVNSVNAFVETAAKMLRHELLDSAPSP